MGLDRFKKCRGASTLSGIDHAHRHPAESFFGSKAHGMFEGGGIGEQKASERGGEDVDAAPFGCHCAMSTKSKLENPLARDGLSGFIKREGGGGGGACGRTPKPKFAPLPIERASVDVEIATRLSLKLKNLLDLRAECIDRSAIRRNSGWGSSEDDSTVDGRDERRCALKDRV